MENHVTHEEDQATAVENIEALFDTLKQYGQTNIDLVKLKAADKFSEIISSAIAATPDATRRLDRAISRDRLRNVLIISGVALAIGGILMAVYPFGPPISNPVAIPKADPHAGLWLAQALPAETAFRTGLVISALGAAMLVLVMFLGIRKTRNDADRKV